MRNVHPITDHSQLQDKGSSTAVVAAPTAFAWTISHHSIFSIWSLFVEQEEEEERAKEFDSFTCSFSSESCYSSPLFARVPCHLICTIGSLYSLDYLSQLHHIFIFIFDKLTCILLSSAS